MQANQQNNRARNNIARNANNRNQRVVGGQNGNQPGANAGNRNLPEFRAQRLHLNEMRAAMEQNGVNNNIIALLRVAELPTLAELNEVGVHNIFDAVANIDITPDWGMIPLLDLVANNLRDNQNANFAGLFQPLIPYIDRVVIWDQGRLQPVQNGPLFDQVHRYQDFRANAVHNRNRLGADHRAREVGAQEVVLEDGHIIQRAAANVVVPPVPNVEANLVAGALFGHAFRDAPTNEEFCVALGFPYTDARLQQLRGRIATFAIGGRNYFCTQDDLRLVMDVGDFNVLGNAQYQFVANPDLGNVRQRAMPIWAAVAPLEVVAPDDVAVNNYINNLVQRAPVILAGRGEIQDFLARYYGWLQGEVVLQMRQIIRLPQRAQFDILNALQQCVDIAPLIVCIASVAVNLQPRMTFPNVMVWENLNMVIVDQNGVQHLVTVREAAAAIFGHAQRNNAQAAIPFIALINNTFRPGPYVNYLIGFNFYAPRGEINRGMLEDIFNNYVQRLAGGIGARRRLDNLLNRIINLGAIAVADRQAALQPWVAMILNLNVAAQREVVIAAVANFFQVPNIGALPQAVEHDAVEPPRDIPADELNQLVNQPQVQARGGLFNWGWGGRR